MGLIEVLDDRQALRQNRAIHHQHRQLPHGVECTVIRCVLPAAIGHQCTGCVS